ncbi:UNVERIFIED_CONTAM: hypothetical protein IGO34_24165, partial [Salmonella enterica subsp. enterica serovar Weltevreden]
FVPPEELPFSVTLVVAQVRAPPAEADAEGGVLFIVTFTTAVLRGEPQLLGSLIVTV